MKELNKKETSEMLLVQSTVSISTILRKLSISGFFKYTLKMKFNLFYAILLVATSFTGECRNEKKRSTRNNNIKVQGNIEIESCSKKVQKLLSITDLGTFLFKTYIKYLRNSFNPHMHETFLQLYYMKWVPGDYSIN